MAQTTINPTRMELMRLKRELSTATRGHKLLKDKQDEMVRQFMNLIKQNRELRETVESELALIAGTFGSARLKMSYAGLMEAFLVPSQNLKLDISDKTIMNIKVPSLKVESSDSTDITYSFAFTPCELDESVLRLSTLVEKMVKLAEIEKS